MNPALRIVVVAPEPFASDPPGSATAGQADRSRSLRIALLENGFNLVAVLPADTYLRERKVIDRAKGLLMRRHGLDEPQAYEKLRKGAMARNLRLVDLAQQLLDARNCWAEMVRCTNVVQLDRQSDLQRAVNPGRLVMR